MWQIGCCGRKRLPCGNMAMSAFPNHCFLCPWAVSSSPKNEIIANTASQAFYAQSLLPESQGTSATWAAIHGELERTIPLISAYYKWEFLGIEPLFAKEAVPA